MTDKLKQEAREEFEAMLFEDGIPSENGGIYGKGSIEDWLKNNEDKHLHYPNVYEEPMLTLDGNKIKDFISSLIDKVSRTKDREFEDLPVDFWFGIVENANKQKAEDQMESYVLSAGEIRETILQTLKDNNRT